MRFDCIFAPSQPLRSLRTGTSNELPVRSQRIREGGRAPQNGAPAPQSLADEDRGRPMSIPLRIGQPCVQTHARSDKMRHDTCDLLIPMNCDALTCPVCGGPMKWVKVLPDKLARLVRFRCTCGHCEDLKDNKPSPSDNTQERLALEGFQELP